MVSGSSPGGRVDAPGARRVAAFHAALCDAAERRDAKDKKEKTTLSDENVSGKRSADFDTAVRWVERAFARPIAVAAARAMTTAGPTEAGAALLSSLVEKHGASCLVATSDFAFPSGRRRCPRPIAMKTANLPRTPASLVRLDASEPCSPSTRNRHAPPRRARGRSRRLSARRRGRGTTRCEGSPDRQEGAVGDASGLATVAAALLILHRDSDRESDRESASRAEGSWRRAALDAVVVDAATAKDARERLGPEASAPSPPPPHTASVTPAAAESLSPEPGVRRRRRRRRRSAVARVRIKRRGVGGGLLPPPTTRTPGRLRRPGDRALRRAAGRGDAAAGRGGRRARRRRPG